MRLATVGIVSLVLLVSAGGIEAGTLRLIAKPGDVIDGREIRSAWSGLDINNSDEVVFRTSFYDEETGYTTGFFTQHRLIATEDDMIGGRTVGFSLGSPSINNSGEVAFSASGVFTDRRVVSPHWGSDPWISDSGAVAFVGTSAGGEYGLVVDDQVLLRPGDTINGRTFDGFGNQVYVRINARNEVAIPWWTGNAVLVFPDSRVIATEGTVIDGRTLLNVRNSYIPINDSGTVAFRGQFEGGSGIFTQNELIVATGDTIDGKTLTSIYTPDSINSGGEIAFHATFDGGKGLFTQDRLITQIGDVIDGRTLTDIAWFEINDLGHVAFSAKFSDGTSGIVLAVPEPSAAVLLLVGASVVALRAAARSRRVGRAERVPPGN
jgi:hypothetical protein